MAFVCPVCWTHGSLEIGMSLALPPDGDWDEISLQVVECSACRFKGAAVYEESRRGALDSETWDHSGYRLDEEDLLALQEAIRQCPKPKDPHCPCSSHRSLGQQVNGRWQGLEKRQGSFGMDLARPPEAGPPPKYSIPKIRVRMAGRFSREARSEPGGNRGEVVKGEQRSPRPAQREPRVASATSRKKIRPDSASDDFCEAEIRNGIFGIEH